MIPALLRLRERVALSLLLAMLIALAWGYALWMARAMGGPDALCMTCFAAPLSVAAPHVRAGMGMSAVHVLSDAAAPLPISHGLTSLAWLLAMWSAMATAMMLPTSIPLLALYARAQQQRAPTRNAALATMHLAGGYLLTWVAFSALASMLQWLLQSGGALIPGIGRLRSSTSAAWVLVGTGVFQWSSLKTACLHRCRTPLAFIMTRFREGRLGAWRMGVEQGLFCVGCCWALMLVVFVAGVMNVLWMALLTLLMLAEKVAPCGKLLARLAGAALIGSGAWLLLR